MWGTRDEFHFAWRQLRGRLHPAGARGVSRARVSTRIARRAGSCAAASTRTPRTWTPRVHGDGLTSLQFRKEKGGVTDAGSSPPAKASDVIQLERRGNTLHLVCRALRRAVHHARDRGVRRGQRARTSGCSCARTTRRSSSRPSFRDVRIIRPAKPDFVPYRDYIGSHLELLDVQTGHRQIIHTSRVPFEAPNWTPDGAALYFNTQRQRSRRRAGACIASTSRRASPRSSTRASRTAATTITCCRSTARWLGHQRSEHRCGPIDDLHAACARRRAEAHHAAHAVVSA